MNQDLHNQHCDGHAEILERERNERYTIEEIADYLGGWTIGTWDEVEELGARVTHNALNQLRDPEDGIAAVRQRRKLRTNIMTFIRYTQ